MGEGIQGGEDDMSEGIQRGEGDMGEGIQGGEDDMGEGTQGGEDEWVKAHKEERMIWVIKAYLVASHSAVLYSSWLMVRVLVAVLLSQYSFLRPESMARAMGVLLLAWHGVSPSPLSILR